jgi:RNA polymerase sigma factor (sigma-70 family)
MRYGIHSTVPAWSTMTTTRTSLLARVKDRRDAAAWGEFHRLYAPLLYRYARGRGLSREDAEDVRDECLAVVAHKIADFEYDRQKGGFKSWLYRIASGKVIDLLRKRREQLADSQDVRNVVDPAPSPDGLWDRHWRYEHLKYCVEAVRGSVSERNYQAFRMLLFDDCPVSEVCVRLGMNANQVYKAKSRVLQRVRAILSDLDLDFSA